MNAIHYLLLNGDVPLKAQTSLYVYNSRNLWLYRKAWLMTSVIYVIEMNGYIDVLCEWVFSQGAVKEV